MIEMTKYLVLVPIVVGLLCLSVLPLTQASGSDGPEYDDMGARDMAEYYDRLGGYGDYIAAMCGEPAPPPVLSGGAEWTYHYEIERFSSPFGGLLPGW